MQSSVGKCDTIDQLIQNRVQCDEAAAALGLADTEAEVVQYTNRPEGCYYEGGALYINDVGIDIDDATVGTSICRSSGFIS